MKIFSVLILLLSLAGKSFCGQIEIDTEGNTIQYNRNEMRPKGDGRVIVINEISTAMSAKFRCLAKKVDYYYDDGGEGTFQGTLTLGKETTTNTYEGHVFYFTMPGRKDKEIARFAMDKNKVCSENFQLPLYFTNKFIP